MDWINQTDRSAQLRALEGQQFDLLVIGGGITGVGVARDAAMRGLSVALIEAQDFASGTSSRSSKMIHGGLRYLVAGDISVVKESASERAILHRIAPHLAQKTPYVIPTHNRRSKLVLRAALWAYERLGGVERSDFHEAWSLDQLKQNEPLIATAGLNGAVVYPEFLTDDARLTVATARSAVAHGACISTYLSAVNIRREGHFVVQARSTLPGDTSEVTLRATAIVNAAGPWVDAVCGLEKEQAPRLALSRGVHLVFKHQDLPVHNTVVMRTHDARRIFAVPLGGYTYIGTTDDYHPECEYWPPVTESDVSYLLAGTRQVMPEANLTPDNIVSVWSGIRPLVADGSGRASKELSRKDEVWVSSSGMLSVGGGKLSAYRAMAERIVDQVVEANGFTAAPCQTAEVALPGGGTATPLTGDWNAVAMERIQRLYGSEAQQVASATSTATDLVAAEVSQAVLSEGALRLEDYWARRSSRAWFDEEAGLPILAQAAHVMGALLNWDATREAAEIENCLAIDAASRAGYANQHYAEDTTDAHRKAS